MSDEVVHHSAPSAQIIYSARSTSTTHGGHELVFECRQKWFAVSAQSVTEVIEAPTVTTVPGSPKWFVGVSIYHSEPVPVIDVGGYFQPDTVDADLDFKRAIIVRVAASHYLLVATKILNLRKPSMHDESNSHSLQNSPDFIEHRAITKLSRIDNKAVALIDLPQLLRQTKLLRECPLV